MHRPLRLLAAAVLTTVACAAAPPPEPAEPVPPAAPPAPPPAAVVPAEAPGAAPTAAPTAVAAASTSTSAPAASPPKKDEGPTACPADMVLVDGDYCTEVEHKCLKSWFDKSNKKVVCELFEPTSTCVGERVKKRYCIDKYEWPNQAGVRPEVMNRFHQAELKCAAVGKRMCTESEWNMACEGPRMLPFPYGYERDADKCNGDRPWDEPDMKKVAKRDPTELARLWQGVPSGSQPQCVSEYGVADMPGNADEVVASEQRKGPGRGEFDSIHTGGPWYKGVRNQCRPKVYTHDEGFYYYFLSFRCCAEADGKPTDPRTPRQISEGWTMKKVEQAALTSLAEVKEKLDLKKQGKCSCRPKDVQCNTLCGTLLGPGAVDAKPRK